MGARRKGTPPQTGGRLGMWWCWTDDHSEDWFVVARGERQAIRFFAASEGYDAADVLAWHAWDLPEALQDAHPGWPSHELIAACGATIVRDETPRVVECGGIRYVEGMLEHIILQVRDDQFEQAGEGRPNGTRRERPS